MITHVDMNTYN